MVLLVARLYAIVRGMFLVKGIMEMLKYLERIKDCRTAIYMQGKQGKQIYVKKIPYFVLR